MFPPRSAPARRAGEPAGEQDAADRGRARAAPCSRSAGRARRPGRAAAAPPSAITIRPATSEAGSKPGRGVMPAPRRPPGWCPGRPRRRSASAGRARRPSAKRSPTRQRADADVGVEVQVARRRARPAGARRRRGRRRACSPSPVSTAPTPIVASVVTHMSSGTSTWISPTPRSSGSSVRPAGSSRSRRSTFISPTPISYPPASVGDRRGPKRAVAPRAVARRGRSRRRRRAGARARARARSASARRRGTRRRRGRRRRR